MACNGHEGGLGKAMQRVLCGLSACLIAGTAWAQAPVAASAASASAAVGCTPAWPRWGQFKQRFVSADGRVVDVGSADDRTVSEGQAYALFFALVANDRATFDTVLRWTEDNLAAGDLTRQLPAWLWGRDHDGTWHVLDPNAASDADLWIAYALLQAGTLWRERSYTARGMMLARHIVEQETATLPGIGLSLLPGPKGFHPNPGEWRVNPSYIPLQVLWGMAGMLPGDAHWRRLAESAPAVLAGSAPHGFAPDWARYRTGQGFLPDVETQGKGSYDAIRVYLWAGMLDSATPGANPLFERFAPFADYVVGHGAPYESIDVTNGQAQRTGNAGFSAAAVPLLTALGRPAAAQAQAERAQSLETRDRPGYYSSVLMLFGLGWHDGRYRFNADGTLAVRWTSMCPGAAR